MRITYADGVLEELVTLAAFIADDNDTTASAFLDACDETFTLLTKQPLIGSKRHFDDSRLAEIRMWRVKGFPVYLIFYKPVDYGIHIYHIIHSAQDYNRIFEND